jgi:hypothetical protein
VASERLLITYDGDALRDGAMDVRQLAPALLAIGDLFERSNTLLNRDRAHVSVRVVATEKGSFVVGLEFWQTIAEHVRALLTHENIIAVDKIITSLFGKAAGLLSVFKLIKLYKGKRIKRLRTLTNGNVEIELPDGTSAEVQKETLELYEDRRVREDAAQSVKPVESEGVDTFEIARNGERLEVVTKPEAEGFRKAAEGPEKRTEEPTLESSAPRIVEIVKPSFADDLVWTVSAGEGERFTAKMADKEFQARVDKGDVFFRKGDVAIMEIATRSWVVDGRVHSEHEIVKVKSFEHGIGEQLELLDPSE